MKYYATPKENYRKNCYEQIMFYIIKIKLLAEPYYAYKCSTRAQLLTYNL